MVGFQSTDQYDNATLDNWIMSIAQGQGYRCCSANIAMESDNSMKVTQISGGISAFVTRTSTGLYTVTFSDDFKNIPFIMPIVSNKAQDANVSSPTVSGCTITTVSYAGAAWSLDDVDFKIVAVGR